MLAHLRGIVADGLLIDSRGLDAIDDEDYLDWLRRHGASDEALNNAVLRGLYGLCFAFRDGDPTQMSIGAGTALRANFPFFFTYRGAIFYLMQAGMGDTVFAPLYEVLRSRNVKFRFFHRVDALHLSKDRR